MAYSKLNGGKMDQVHFTPDSITAMQSIMEHLRSEGSRGSKSEAVRYALIQTARRLLTSSAAPAAV